MGKGNHHDVEGLDADGLLGRRPWQRFIQRRVKDLLSPGVLRSASQARLVVFHHGLRRRTRAWQGRPAAPGQRWLVFSQALLARHMPVLEGHATALSMLGFPIQQVVPGAQPIQQVEPGVRPIQAARTGPARLSGDAQAIELAASAQEIQAVVEHASYRLPDRRLMAFLAGVLRLPAPAVKIYTGPAADFAARRMGADAVSYGEAVFFRRGQYDPYSRRGLGLLGHELTYAALAHTANESENPQAEERLAVENERAIRSNWSFTPVDMAFSPPSAWRQPAATPVEPASTLARAPRAAAVDRDVETRPAQPRASPPLQLTERQLAMIKEAVYRDIKERIRMDFERGG